MRAVTKYLFATGVWAAAAMATALSLTPGFGLLRQAHAGSFVCGQVLTGGPFVLDGDVGPCDDPTGPGLTVTGPATLDLAGFKVFCADTNQNGTLPIGILINGTGATVRMGQVVGCLVGVQADDQGAHTIDHVTAQGNTTAGFRARSRGNKFRQNIAAGNQTDGFLISNPRNLLNNNSASGNTLAGYHFDSVHNKGADNSATENGGPGFFLTTSHNKLNRSTSTDNNGAGFKFLGQADVSRNRINNSTVTGNGGSGFDITGNRNFIFSSTISNNDGDGVTIHGSANEIEADEGPSTISGNGGSGINIVSGAHNELEANTISGNTVDGITIRLLGTLNHILGNEVFDNGQAGINVFGTSNVIQQANTANGNATFDAADHNPGCDTNRWHNNSFGTTNQTCIH